MLAAEPQISGGGRVAAAEWQKHDNGSDHEGSIQPTIDSHTPTNFTDKSTVDKALTPFTAVWNYLFDRDYHIHLLGLWLFFLYTSYQPVQSLQTIRYPSIGSYNLALVWGFFGGTSIFAPLWIELLGPALCVPLFGSLTIIFPLTLVSGNQTASLVGAALFGCGAGTLWPAAGRVIASVSTQRDETTNAAIFQTYYRLAALVGGLILAGLNAPSSSWNSTDDWKYQYLVFSASTAIGTGMGFVLYWSYNRSMKRKDEAMSQRMRVLIQELTDAGQTEDADRLRETLAEKKVDMKLILHRLWHHWKQTFRLAISPEYLPIAALQLTISGFGQSWFSGNFNGAISALSTGYASTGVSWVGWVSAIDQGFAVAGATLTGLALAWAARTYEVNPRRWLYPTYIGICCSVAAYGLSIYVVHVYMDIGVTAYGWGNYFGIVIVTCLLYWVGIIAIEVTYYATNISLFGTISVSAFNLRAFFEGMGNMSGYLINNHLTSEYNRKITWPVTLLCLSILPIILVLFFFPLPKHYTAHENIRLNWQAQQYKHESEALDIAMRENQARITEGAVAPDDEPATIQVQLHKDVDEIATNKKSTDSSDNYKDGIAYDLNKEAITP